VALALTGRPGQRPALAVTVHNAPSAAPGAAAVYALLAWIVARRADAVTWVSDDLGARLRRRGARDAGRALVPAPPAPAPSPAQVAKARDDLGGTGRPVVLAAGRLTPQKGFGVLIAAAPLWRHRNPEPVLAIAGDGPLAPALAEQARAAGPGVHLLGQRGDVPALLAAADVVVVPSMWEGQPMFLQEALRAGKPVVASRVGGIPALTGDDGALLVPPGDAAALAAAVESVLDHPALAAKLATAAAQRGAALPSAAAATDAAITLYHRLTAPPADRHRG
jgi:glycosyltransferase involved in cell wall biosynthesis